MLTTAHRPVSQQLFEKLKSLIPGGVSSAGRAFKGFDETPLIAAEGHGDTLTDVDGNHYIDYCCSWGALLHGHSHPKIVDAVAKQLQKGSMFGLSCEQEGQLAQKIIDLHPSVEMVRFVNSGTEATMSAIRLARGFTGKELLIKFIGNYHGHADFLLVQSGSGVANISPTSTSAGIPDSIVKNTYCLPFNDPAVFKEIIQKPEISSNLATVIIEPIAGNMGTIPATMEFLELLRNETKRVGAMLIFDEVMTGFRVARGGAEEHYGIHPDIACFGKVMGGGFPTAAFGARKEIMEQLAPLGPVYQAGTLSGNPIAMVAGCASLELASAPETYRELDRKTRIITDPIKQWTEAQGADLCVNQVGGMFSLFFGANSVKNFSDVQQLNHKLFMKYFRHLLYEGIFIPPSQYEACFISTVHTDENLEKTRDAILDFLKKNFSSSLRLD